MLIGVSIAAAAAAVTAVAAIVVATVVVVGGGVAAAVQFEKAMCGCCHIFRGLCTPCWSAGGALHWGAARQLQASSKDTHSPPK